MVVSKVPLRDSFYGSMSVSYIRGSIRVPINGVLRPHNVLHGYMEPIGWTHQAAGYKLGLGLGFKG